MGSSFGSSAAVLVVEARRIENGSFPIEPQIVWRAAFVASSLEGNSKSVVPEVFLSVRMGEVFPVDVRDDASGGSRRSQG